MKLNYYGAVTIVKYVRCNCRKRVALVSCLSCGSHRYASSSLSTNQAVDGIQLGSPMASGHHSVVCRRPNIDIVSCNVTQVIAVSGDRLCRSVMPPSIHNNSIVISISPNMTYFNWTYLIFFVILLVKTLVVCANPYEGIKDIFYIDCFMHDRHALVLVCAVFWFLR